MSTEAEIWRAVEREARELRESAEVAQSDPDLKHWSEGWFAGRASGLRLFEGVARGMAEQVEQREAEAVKAVTE